MSALAEYKVVEKFVSINGEGTRAGELAVFIRMKGCNLDCEYCDTKWANEENASCEIMTEEDIRNYIRDTGVKNVTLTGGEPLFRKDMDVLIDYLLQDKDRVVEIETNGSVNIKEYAEMKNRASFTMDYKLGASGMEEKMCLENFAYLDKRDTVKFVVGSQEDLKRAAEIIEKYALTGKVSVYFSPVFGAIEPEEIVDFMVQNRLNDVRMQLQMHKFIWDPEKRGV